MMDRNARKERKNKRRAAAGSFIKGVVGLWRRLLRFILSRYFITAILILAEVALVDYMLYILAEHMLTVIVFAFVFYVVGFIHLVNRDVNPEYKIVWMAIMLVPIGGVALYFLFFDRRLSKREVQILRDSYGELVGDADEGVKIDSDSPHYGKVQALLSDDPIADVYGRTSSVFFSSGEEYFDSLIRDIEGAEKYIYLEYFIIDRGELWDRIHVILRQKAEAGLDIRILYDDIGCMQTLPSYYEYVLRNEGISAYRFGRVSPRLSSVHNNRDHRKIAIIDGKVGYTGGVNIADEYANIIERFGHWQDGGIRLSGNGVKGLLRLFLSAWDFTLGRKTDYTAAISEIVEDGEGDGGLYVPFGSGPTPIYQQKVGKNLFLNIINQATRYVYITTPYLIIDYELTEALCKAASRGVCVRIITPGIPDKKIVKIMTKSAYPYLIKAGVEIYEYLPGFIHEKTVISDDRYLVTGTINFDYRSLMHHFEDGVLVLDSPVIFDAKAAYEQTLSKSDLRDQKEAKLTFVEWTFRNLIKIFAPLL